MLRSEQVDVPFDLAPDISVEVIGRCIVSIPSYTDPADISVIIPDIDRAMLNLHVLT
ncbi:MAG: hypothetical protein KAT58_09830 [candidate division Zixibacteria bacterium]|nr:hypothetical protein [candidate division Zixibacteria bacterium]